MNVAMALWGAMSGGGPELSGPALRDQIILQNVQKEAIALRRKQRPGNRVVDLAGQIEQRLIFGSPLCARRSICRGLGDLSRRDDTLG